MNYPKLIRSVGLLVSACTVPVFAQTVWTGAVSSSYNAAGNWSNSELPSSAISAVFDSTSTANLTNITVQPAINTLGITVTSPGSNVGLTIGSGTSGATISVGTGGITLNGTRDLMVTRGTTTAATFLNVAATQTWAISSGRSLGISTTAEYDMNFTGGVTVTMNGGGAVNITATSFDIGQTQTSGVIVDGVTLTTSSNLRLGQSNSGGTAHGVGNLTINSGAVNVGNVLQFGSNGGASGNLVVQSGATLSVSQITSAATAGASTATFDGATLRAKTTGVNLINAGNFTTSLGDGGLNVATDGNNVTIAAIMGNKSGEIGVFTKSGLGTLTLSATNTYTGLTTVSAGTLAVDVTGNLSSTAYTVANGATLDFSAKSQSQVSLLGIALTLDAGAGTNGFFNAGLADLGLGGSLTINFTTLTPDASYNLIDHGAQFGDFTSVALNGLFSGGLSLTSADTWTGEIGGYSWTFNEDTGILTTSSVIPEPSAFAVLAGMVGLGSAGLRRRRRA